MSEIVNIALVGIADYGYNYVNRLLDESAGKIDEELANVAPLLKEGGYIPWCDHHVPPDVSLANYQYYVKRMKEASLNPDEFIKNFRS